MNQTKLYRVLRPYCTPGDVYLYATSKTAAVNKAHKKYGFASDTTAKLVTDKLTLFLTKI